MEDMEQYCNTQIVDPSTTDMESYMHVVDILAAMQQVDPDGERIGRMYIAGYTDAEIARALGIPRSTFHDRKNRIRKHIKYVYGSDKKENN